MKLFRRITSAVSALSLAVCSAPYVLESTVSHADGLLTRDVWCANEDVNRWESEHFQFIWGKNGADSGKVTQQFLEENAKHLEACWDVYMNELSMEPPTQSVNMALRDGNQYKVNFYISGTGLSPFEDDWAYMGYDSQGYAFMFCCMDSMNNSPNPSWVLPHEFGHVVTAHQLGWNDNKYVQAWWESIGNWYREQFLYSDYYQQWVTDPASGTDYFETYMKNLCFTPILGRDNYASWAFLQYLTENPDNLEGYGSDFVKNLMQNGQRDEYPYLEIERLAGADLKDTLGHYAKRMATIDLEKQESYRARQNELLARGEWNWGEIFTILEKSGKSDNYYTVPTERAPQQMGINIIPLEPTDGRISVTLESLTDVKGADWRACIAVEQRDGTTRYSELFSDGETAEMTFDSNTDSTAYLTVTATPDSDTLVQCGVPWAYGEGEFDENNMPFLSKTRYPYAVKLSGAGIKQSQDSTGMSQGSYHPNGGGFVASTAHVDDSVYVGKNAKVLGYATVSGNAVIDDYAVITGNATVSGNAVVKGHAVVAETATVKDNAIIGDSAGVMGRAVISDNARVIESGLVYDNYQVSGNATVKGVAFCMIGGSATGQAMPDGDYYDDSSRTIQAGSVYGWTSPDSYINSRPYSDGQIAGLEFNTDSSKIAEDTYTSTYGTVIGNPKWDETKTSAKGVLTFNGVNQYIIADSSYAMCHDVEYQTAVLIRDESGEILHFSNDEKYMALTYFDGDLGFVMNDSDHGAQTIIAKNAYKAGEWATISVSLIGDTAKITVNGNTVAESTFTLDPIDIVAEDTKYLIGASTGGVYMDGSMDFFRVNFKDVAEPEYYYTETEQVTARLMGDVNLDGEVNVADAVMLQNWLMKSGEITDWQNGDLVSDGRLDVLDMIEMRKLIAK
ncbi:MAG: DUF6055 domain-containing protein [Ruminococcus flavefaciens]|nr:DUF6055 domain-containing protein [Ruminococcus flavefaciens]MCM1229939.1 DUF6055 domain-containing protein [Ruminococcus flavefaciens]